MKKLISISLCLCWFMIIQSLPVLAQFPERQIPVVVTAKPQKAVYLAREPILIDVEIRNGLEHEIRISRYSFSPNDWNGETIGVELHDIYRLPVMRQIGLKRPAINIEKMPLIQGASWVPIPPGTSKITTVDVRKWEVCDGWIPGKYQILVRADKIDVDKHSWINVTGEPVTVEIKPEM